MSVDTTNDLLNDLGIESLENQTLQAMLSGETRYLKDLRMNYKSLLRSKNLNEKEVYLLSLSIANNNGNAVLETAFRAKAKEAGANDAEIAETLACASMLSANNVLYRFRHFMNKESYDNARAGLRMQIMMKPVLGKEFFELMSLAVSAVNGCEMCIRSHEESLLNLESTEDRIFEAIRVASVITSLSKVIY